jgi:DNA helicase HerA-like ATPase
MLSAIMRKKSHTEYLYHKDRSRKHVNSKSIGKTIAGYSYPSTIDGFWFVVAPGTILNTFDFVTVNNFKSKTIGLVQDIKALPPAVLNSRGVDDGLPEYGEKNKFLGQQVLPSMLSTRHGVIAASVAVIGNTGIRMKTDKLKTINLPILTGLDVRFSTKNEVLFALGVPEMETPVAAGIIEMSNGLQIPVSLDITYLAGPDTAHMNVTGISGNKKTSYTLFLLQSLSQKLQDMDNGTDKSNKGISAIIFNTKADDLLYLHNKAKHIENDTRKAFQNLELKLQAFNNVTYFLPRGTDGMPNSLHIPESFKTYSFELRDIYDRLDLLFSGSSDISGTSSITDYIHESWPMDDNSGRKISNWTDLTKFVQYPKYVIYNKTMMQDFIGHIQRYRKSPLFVDKKTKSTYLGDEIKKIKANEIFVVDVSAIPSVEEQAFVIGDVFKSINELYSIGPSNRTTRAEYNLSAYESKKKQKGYPEGRFEIPKYMVIFLDEINRFIPKSPPMARLNPVADQILRFVIEGRSRCNILLSAQQFKSETDFRLQENIGLHVIGKLGITELLTEPYYSMIDEQVKRNIARLERGEMIIIHPAFRHPVKVWFPDSSYQRP